MCVDAAVRAAWVEGQRLKTQVTAPFICHYMNRWDTKYTPLLKTVLMLFKIRQEVTDDAVLSWEAMSSMPPDAVARKNA